MAELAIDFGSVEQAVDSELMALGASCSLVELAFDLGLVGLEVDFELVAKAFDCRSIELATIQGDDSIFGNTGVGGFSANSGITGVSVGLVC